MGCQVVACDVSQAAFDLGRRLFDEQPLPVPAIAAPRFLHFDGRKLDLPDASVDRIVCFDAFHHVPNQEEVLAELARAWRGSSSRAPTTRRRPKRSTKWPTTRYSKTTSPGRD